MKKYFLSAGFIIVLSICAQQSFAQDSTNKIPQQQISPAQQQMNVNEQQEQMNGSPVINNDQSPVNNGQPSINGINVPLHSPTPSTNVGKDSTTTTTPLNAQQTAPNGKQPAPHF